MKIVYTTTALAIICIAYSIFLHFQLLAAGTAIEELKEEVIEVRAINEYSHLKVDTLICENIDIVDDLESTVIKIGNEDNETFIKFLDKSKNPSIELVDNHSANFISLRDLDKSESHFTIGDTNGDWYPTLTLGKIATEREWMSQEFIDGLYGPIFYLSDVGNRLVLQSYIGKGQATYFQLGNNREAPFMRSDRSGGATVGIGTTDNNNDIIGMRVEAVNDDNVYHFTKQPGKDFVVKNGVWSDLVGTFMSNNAEKKDSLFFGYTDTDYSQAPAINTYLDGELIYNVSLKGSDK